MWWLVGILTALVAVLYFFCMHFFIKWKECQTETFELEEIINGLKYKAAQKDENYRTYIREMAQRVIDADRFSRKVERFHKAIEAELQSQLDNAHIFLEQALNAASRKNLGRAHKFDRDEARRLFVK